MSRQYYYLESILSALKENEFLAVWEFLESEVSQNNWFAIVLIIFLGVVFEVVLVKICTSLQRKPALSENTTSDSRENEDSSGLSSMTFDNQSMYSSTVEGNDVFSERTMSSSLLSFPLISQGSESPFKNRVPPQSETPLLLTDSHSNESKYHVSYFSESHMSSTRGSNSSLSMTHSEVKKIFLSFRDHLENKQETIQFSSKQLFSIMKTKKPNTLMYPSNYRLTRTSTVSQEHEIPDVLPCPLAHLLLTKDQISLLEENVKNQISFKSKVTFEGKISYLLSKSQDSLLQKKHFVQVNTFAQAPDSLPGHKTVKNQSFYEDKLTHQGQQLIYNQESVRQHDTEVKCLDLPQDVNKSFGSSIQESSQARNVDRNLHLTNDSCVIECQDSIKFPESDRKHSDETQSSVWFQESNKIKESTQNPAITCKNAKHLISAVMPYSVAKEMPKLKSIKEKDQLQIASSKLRQDSPFDSVPLFPTIKRHNRKALSSIALCLIYVSNPVLPYIKKYSKRNLVKVVLGLIVCKDFFLKQKKSPGVEKVKSSHSVEKRGALGNIVNIKQDRRNIKGIKNISSKVSLQLEQANGQLSAPCSSTERKWNDKWKESLKDSLTQANAIDIAEFHALSSKRTSGQHDLEYGIFLNESILQLMRKSISSFKMQSNRRLKIVKELRSLEKFHLPVSNREKVPTSKPDVERSFLKEDSQKDLMKTALESVDINLFLSLGTKKHENSEQLAYMKNKESMEDNILKEKTPSILNITKYNNQNYGISQSKDLEDQPRSNIKNTQGDAFHSVPYATISEPPAMGMESRLKAKTDILRTVGLGCSASMQEENPDEKKMHMKEQCRFEMPQLLDKEEEEQETILYCGGEEKVQYGEEGEQNSAAQHPAHLPLYLYHLQESHQNTSDLEVGWLAQGPPINEQDAPHLTQTFTLDLQLQQKTKFEAQPSSGGKRKNKEKEPEVKLQTSLTQRTWGTCQCPMKGSSQDGNVKSCTERLRGGESADNHETRECGGPFDGDPRKSPGVAGEEEIKALSEIMLGSFITHLFPSSYLKRQEIQNKLSGRHRVLRPRYVTMKAKEPAISLLPHSNRHGSPNHRARLRGNGKILEQMQDWLLNATYPHKVSLPHIKTHSSTLSAETLSHVDPNQEESLVDKEGKCSDFINTGSNARGPLTAKLQDEVRGDEETAPTEVLQENLSLRLSSYPKEKLRTEKELRHPTPCVEILTRPVYFNLTDWAEIENTKENPMAESDIKDSVGMGMAPVTSRKPLLTEEPSNSTRKNRVEYPISDNTGEMSCRFLSTKIDLQEQELDSFSGTSDGCMTALCCSKMKTKKVRFLLTECPEGDRSADNTTAKSTHHQKVSILSRKNLELNLKTGNENIQQANEPKHEFLSQLFSPRPSQVQGERDGSGHIPLKQGGRANEGRPWNAGFFLKGAAFSDREEKVQHGEEEGGRPCPEAASQGLPGIQLNMNDQPEKCPNTPEPEPDTLAWELLVMEHDVQGHTHWTFPETILQVAPGAPIGYQATKTENHLLASSDIKIPLPSPGNGASLDNVLNTAMEEGSPACGKPERNLNFYFLPRNPELSNDLQVSFLQSSGSTRHDDLKHNKKKNILKSTRKQMFLGQEYKTLRPSISHKLEGRGNKELLGNFQRKSRNWELRKKVTNVFSDISHSKIPVMFNIKMNKLNLETNRIKTASCDHMQLIQETSPNGERICNPDSVVLSSFSNNMEDRKQVEEAKTLPTLANSQDSKFDVHQKDHDLIKPHEEATQPQMTNITVQLQTQLIPNSLNSGSCPRLYQFSLENMENHVGLLHLKSGKAKMNEIIFSARELDLPSDANDLKEKAGSTEKEKTTSFDLSSPFLSTTKRKRNFKQNSGMNTLGNLRCGITKAKKPSISHVLRIQGDSSMKHRGKLRYSSEPKMQEVAPGINMADTMDSFVTITPNVSIDSNIDKREKRLSSKHIREEASPPNGDMTSYSDSYQEEEEEESRKNTFNKIQHFTFQPGQRKKTDLDILEKQGSETILFIIQQILSQQVQPVEPVLGKESKAKPETPNDMICSGSSKFPLLKSKKLPLGQVVIGAGKNSFPSNRSLSGNEDFSDNIETAEFKKDQQATTLESLDISTSGFYESKKKILMHRALKSKKNSRCVLFKAKKSLISSIFNIPQNDCRKTLPPKTLSAQSFDFFTYIKHSGILENLTAEKNIEGLLHQRPAESLEFLDLSLLSEPELKRKRHNLKVILRRKKVNPKYITLRTKKVPISQTFNITKRGAPSHTMQFKHNFKVMVDQGKPMADIILDVVFSAIPISSDNQMKADTDKVWETKSSSFLPQQEQNPDGEGTRGSDSREEKASVPEDRKETEDQTGEVALQNDQPFDLNVTEVKMPHSVKLDLEFKDSLPRKDEESPGPKSVRTMKDDFFTAKTELSATSDKVPIRMLGVHSEVSLQPEDVDKSIRTQKMFKTDNQDTSYTASWKLVYTDPWSESSGERVGGHFANSYKELQRDELMTLMMPKLSESKRQKTPLKFIKRKDLMGVRHKIRKAKMPVISQILNITESGHLYGKKKQENNSRFMSKGMQEKQRITYAFSFLPLTLIDKLDIKMHKALKTELDKSIVETGNRTHHELDKLCDRGALKANSSGPYKRSSNTMEINGQQKQEENKPKLSSETIPYYIQHSKSKVCHVTYPSPCKSESEQSTSEGRKTRDFSCLVEKVKQEESIRENILKSISRYLIDLSQVETMGKHPHPQKEKEVIAGLKTPFPGEWKQETHSGNGISADRDPRRKLDLHISEKETGNLNELLRMALKSLSFSNLQPSKPRSQDYSLEYGDKESMIPKYVSLEVEKKFPVLQMPNITRSCTGSHFKVKQTKNECTRKVSLCAPEGVEMLPSRSVSDELLFHMTTRGMQHKRTLHKTPDGHLTGEKAELGNLTTTLDSSMPVLSDSKSQINKVQENKVLLDSIYLTLKEKGSSLSHVLNGKFASHMKNRESRLGTSMKVMKIVKDVVDPIVKSICSALDIVDTAEQSKLHIEEVETSSFSLIRPVKMEFPVERLLCSAPSNVPDPSTLSITTEQKQKVGIVKARTALNAGLQSTQAPMPITLHTEMNQSSSFCENCEESSRNNSFLHKAKTGENDCEEQVLLRTAVQCDTQPFEFGADGRRDTVPFKSEARSIYIGCPKDSITPQNMDIDLDQEANTGIEDLGLETAPFSETHLLEIRGWKKIEKSPKWKRLTNPKIMIPKTKKSLTDTHFSSTTEFDGLLQPREEKGATGQNMLLNVWSSMTDKASNKCILVEHPSCAEGTGSLRTGKGSQPEKCTHEALPMSASHPKVGHLQISIPLQQVKSHLINLIYCEYSTPLAKKAVKGADIPLGLAKKNKERQNLWNKGQNQQQPLSISHEKSLEQNLPYSLHDPWILQQIMSPIKETLSKVISVPRRKSRSDLFPKTQLEAVSGFKPKMTGHWIPPEHIKQNTGLHSGSHSKTSNYKNVLFPKGKKSFASVQEVSSLSNGSNRRRRIQKKRQSHKSYRKVQKEIYQHIIFSYFLTIYKPMFPKSKRQKNKVRRRLNQKILRFRRRILKLKVAELSYLFHATDHETYSYRQDLHWNITGKMVRVEHKKVKLHFPGADVHDFIPSSPHLKSNQETVDGINVRETQTPLLLRMKVRVKESNIRGVKNTNVNWRTKKSSVSQHNGKHLPMILNTIKQEDTGQGGEGPSKPTSLCPPFPFLSCSNLNSRIPEGERKSGLPRICLPPLPSQEGGSSRQTSAESLSRGDLSNGIKSRHYFPQVKMNHVPKMNDIMDLKCIGFKGKRTPFKHLLFGKKPQWNNRGKKRLMKKDENNLDNPHTYISSLYLKRGSGRKEVCMQGKRSSHSIVTLQDVPATMEVCKEPANTTVSRMDKEQVSQKDESTMERTWEEISPLDRTAKQERLAPITQGLELTNEKEMQKTPDKVEVMTKKTQKPPNSTSFPQYPEADRRTKEGIIVNTISAFLCPKLWDAITTQKIASTEAVSADRSASVQNTNGHITREYGREEKPKSILGRKKTPAILHKRQLAFQEQEKKIKKIKSEANKVLTTSTFVSASSHLTSCTQTRRLNFLTDITRLPLPKPPQRNLSMAVKKTSDKSTQASIANQVQETELCNLQREEHRNLQAKKDTSYTKDESSHALYQHTPRKLQEQGRGDSRSGKYGRMSTGEQDISLATHQTSDSLVTYHELDTRKEDTQGITRCDISQPCSQTLFDAGKILHAKSNGDDVSGVVKTAHKHEPENGEDRLGGTVAMSSLMYSKGFIPKADTFSLPPGLSTSVSRGTHVTEEKTKIKGPLGYAQEREMKPDKVLTKAFLPQMKTAKGVDNDRGPIGSLIPLWHRSTNADQQTYTGSPLDAVPSCSHRVKFVPFQEEADKACVGDKDSMDFRNPAKKTPLSLFLSEFLQANVNDQVKGEFLRSRREGVFQNKFGSVRMSSTRLQFTLKKEAASGAGMPMPPLEIKGPLPSGQMSQPIDESEQEGKPHPPETGGKARREAKSSDRQLKDTDLQVKTSSLPEYHTAGQGPWRRLRDNMEAGPEEKAKREQHRASDEGVVILTKPCASQHRSQTRTEGGKDLLANTGYMSQSQLHRPPNSGKTRDADTHGGTDVGVSMRRAGHCVPREKTRERVKVESKKGRLFTQVLALRAETCPLGLLSSTKVPYLNDVWQRQEGQEGQDKPKVVQSETFSPFPAQSYLKGGTRRKRNEDPLDRIKPSSPPFKSQKLPKSENKARNKSSVDYRLKEKERMDKSEKMPHTWMDPKAKKASKAHRLDSRKLQWKIKELERMVQENKTDLAVGLKNICTTTFVTLPNVNMGSSEKEYMIRITNYVHRPHQFSEVAKTVHLATIDQELSSSVKVLKEPTLQKDNQAREKNVAVNTTVDSKDVCLKTKESLMLLRSGQSNFMKTEEPEKEILEGQCALSDVRLTNLPAPASPPLPAKVDPVYVGESIEVMTRFSVATVKVRESLDSKEAMHVVPMSFDILISPQAGTQGLAQRNPGDRGHLPCFEHQEEKMQESRTDPREVVIQSSLSAFSLSALHLESSGQADGMRVCEETAVQSLAVVAGRSPTEILSPSSLEDVPTEKEQEPQERRSSQKGTAEERGRTHVTQMTCKSNNLQRPYIRHRTEMHLSIGGREQRTHEGGSRSCSKMLRKICTSQPSPKNLNSDKGTQIDMGTLGVQGPSVQPIVLLMLSNTEKTRASEAKGGGGRNNDPCKFQREKKCGVQTMNLRVKVQPQFRRGSPMSQILDSKEFVLNITEQKKNVPGDRDEPCVVLTRTLISTPAEPIFYLSPGDRTNRGVPANARARPSKYRLQKPSDTQEGATGKSAESGRGAFAVKKAQYPQTRQEVARPRVSHFTISLQGKNPQVNTEGELNQLVLNPKEFYFTGSGSLRNGDGLEHFRASPKLRAPSEADKAPASTEVLSYPTRKPVTADNWQKELEIKGNFNQKINPEVLFSSQRKIPLEISFTRDTSANSKEFSVFDESRDPLCKAPSGSAKSCQRDKMKKDVRSCYQLNRMLHTARVEGSLDKTSVTGLNVPPDTDNQVSTTVQRGLPCGREANTGLASGLYLKFPLQQGKQVTLSTMTVDMQMAGYPRRQELAGTRMDRTEFDAQSRQDQPAWLVPGETKFILKSLQTSICPCRSLSLSPADLEGVSERKNGGNFKKNTGNSVKKKAPSWKAPSSLIPQKHNKEPKVPETIQNIQSQKLFTKYDPGSFYPTVPLSPKGEDWEDRFTAAHAKRESSPQSLTLKISNHPILQFLGNVKQLEFDSVAPKEITLWDENGAKMYLGNFYLSRFLAPQAEAAERYRGRGKGSCPQEPQESLGTSHTMCSVWSTEDRNLANTLPGHRQLLGVQPQDAQNGCGVASGADCSSRGTNVLAGHHASRLSKDPKSLVLEQEEKAPEAATVPTAPTSMCTEPKEAVETPVTVGPVSPPGVADTWRGAQPGHTLERYTLPKFPGPCSPGQDTRPEGLGQPQGSAGPVALPLLHVERRESKLVSWKSQEENSLPIPQPTQSYVASHTSVHDGAHPGPKAGHACQPGEQKSRSPPGRPDIAAPPETSLLVKSTSERFPPEGEMNLQRHLVSKRQEMPHDLVPGGVTQSLQMHTFRPEEEAAPGDAHRKVCRLSVEGLDTVELDLMHKGLGGAAPGSPLKSLIIHFSDKSAEAQRRPGGRKPESRPVASAPESSWPPILQKCPMGLRDKLLIHFARKTLEFQVRSFPRIVRASHMAARSGEVKPLSRCLRPEVPGPNPPSRTLLPFDEESLHQIDLDLRCKYFRFLLGVPVKGSFPKPKALPKYILKLNTAAACKNVQHGVQGGGPAVDRDWAEKHFSLPNLSHLQNSLWIRKALKSLLVAASAPGGSGREQRDTTGLHERRHPVTKKDKRSHVWFQETVPCSGPRPQKNAAGAVKFQSARPPEASLRHKTDPKAAAASASEQSLSLSVQNSEECMILEANSYLGQESASILYEVQNGVPLEKAKMKKIKLRRKSPGGDTLGPGQFWLCGRHSLAVTSPHPESRRGRKHRPSSRRYAPGWGPDMSLAEPSLKSSISGLHEKRLWTTRNKTHCSLAPLTESNLKLHLARSQGRPYWSYKSKDRKKVKMELLRKNHGHQDRGHGHPRSPGERRRKRVGIYHELGTSDYVSRRNKSVWKPPPGEPRACCERKPRQPFFYACIPADSLEIIPQTIRWTIPPQTLRKSNFRAPLVVKVSSTCSLWGSPRKVLESFWDPFRVSHPD